MAEQPQSSPDQDKPDEDEQSPQSTEPLQIDTPVIQMQDLEYNPGPQTRVSNKGVKIEPRIDSDDQHDFAAGDEAVLQALEELEQQYKEQPPG